MSAARNDAEPMFPPESVIRRVNIEPAIALGAGRALLLQLAHPAVAQGVQDHSEFKQNPFKRLQGTLEATYAAVFGPRDLAEGVGRRIRWVHDFVTGPTYQANDPANLLWVHATLVDTALGCYEDFVGRLRADDAEAYYQQMKRVAELFGLSPADQPATLGDFRAYFDATVASLTVTEAGRDLGQFIVDPTLPLRLDVPMAPLLSVFRRLTIARLPASLRPQFGFDWSPADEARGAALTRRLRRVYRGVPRPVRTAATRANGAYLLRLAQRHVREFDAKQRQPAG